MSFEKSINWMTKSANLIDGINVDDADRTKVSVSLLSLSMEHNRGINLLIQNTVDASGFALLRPQFEAYVRGVWYSRCATEEEIQYFIERNEPAKIYKLIDEIEKVAGFEGGDLKRSRDEIRKHLNDYTHGGTTQMKARFSAGEIGSNFTQEHVDWLLNTSSCYSLLAGIAIAQIIKSDALANSLHDLYKEIYKPE